MVTTVLAALLFQDRQNTLSAAEVNAGWKLLFDGKTTKGWTNYKSDTIKAGWTVKDGVLTCSDPENAGDIVTKDNYDWFELTLEFNLGKGQNSGIIFHATDEGKTVWQSGPEVQLYDHPAEPGVQITGYLYELYDSKVDAQKPAGEWNKMRIVISPSKCATYVNDVKYYEYVLGSEEFWARVAKSKFSEYPYFAKSNTGKIALQGDHGVVSFRNIKIRPIKAG
jgi:hypothetical protein